MCERLGEPKYSLHLFHGHLIWYREACALQRAWLQVPLTLVCARGQLSRTTGIGALTAILEAWEREGKICRACGEEAWGPLAWSRLQRAWIWSGEQYGQGTSLSQPHWRCGHTIFVAGSTTWPSDSGMDWRRLPRGLIS